MPGGSPATLMILIGGLVCCVLVPRLVTRKPSPSPCPKSHPTRSHSGRQAQTFLLSALLCTVGALLLIPWSSALAWTGRPAFRLGVILIVLVGTGALYALVSPTPHSRGRPQA